MPFPETPRVIYKNNPLALVLCQLRFPKLLKIAEKQPAGFQERIRDVYPLYSERKEGPEVPAALREVFSIGETSLHDFKTADEFWTLTLGSEFIALATTKYTRFDEFDGRLRASAAALIDEFRPSFWTRVGLRYRDVIRRTDLGFPKDLPWSELINPRVLGELAADEAAISSAIIESRSNTLLSLSTHHPSQVRIRHGLESEDEEQTYVIDTDFYTTVRLDIESTHRLLGEFKLRAARLFNWAITPKLRNALGPTDAPEFVLRD